jgi:hypothetical protein
MVVETATVPPATERDRATRNPSMTVPARNLDVTGPG